MVATLIPTSSRDASPLHAVVKLAGDVCGAEVGGGAGAALTAGRVADAVAILAASDLLTSAPEKDAEAAFLVLSHAAAALPGPAGEEAVASLVARLGGPAPGASDALRLRCLFSLFNATGAPATRAASLLGALRFGAASAQAEPLLPAVAQLGAWLPAWGVDPAVVRALRRAAYDVVCVAPGAPPALKLATLSAYLRLFDDAPPAELGELRPLAAACACLLVGCPAAFEGGDVSSLAAVRALASFPDTAPVAQLLAVFLTGRLAGFTSWRAAHEGVLRAHGLDAAACASKMRLLSLAALGADAPGGVVPYDAVAASLEVGAHEVEPWVVAAIGARLLDAKLDAVHRRVLVTRAAHRVFGAAQWGALAARLAAWRDAVAAAAAAEPPGAGRSAAQGAPHGKGAKEYF